MRYAIRHRLLASLALIAVICAVLLPCKSDAANDNSLWSVYQQALKGAKYVDLTHTITPNIPVRAGFADSTFAPAKAGADIEGFAKSGEVYTYAKHGFEATEYILRTAQLGTQLDPPALGAGVSCNRRATCDLCDAAARGHLHRRAVKDQLELRPPGVRHRGVGKGA